jgi:hypothetical protein
MSIGSELREEQSALALERLGRGLKVSAGAFMVLQFISVCFNADRYPRLGLSVSAWIILAGTTAFMMLPQFGLGRHVRGFPLVLGACTAVVALDVAGSWTSSVDGPYPAAATAVGGVLLICAHTQRLRWVLLATAALCGALIAVYSTSMEGDPLLLGPRIFVLLLAGLPPVVGASVVRSFRSLVQIESDRAQAQAAAAVSGTGVGLMASQELAKLDLDAERLLDSVATGQAALPLDAKASASAASIATELRLHLIAGRGRTWLYHAVSESAILGPLVTVTDPMGLAARLSTAQRDALLSAVWLFAGDLTRGTQSLRVDVHQPKLATGSFRRVAIGIEAHGVPRKQVDPAVWQAIGKVGRYVESTRGVALCVDIDCHLGSQSDR